ncbi:hypothetical protein [Providencia sp. PROV089]|uniref:hypothetical protein n=1 Tax=Providencia sp. PROV089 TaxID=2949805 RepID=UPI0023491FC5|nr:hypothetical protein [Providencia sp. PROV089]
MKKLSAVMLISLSFMASACTSNKPYSNAKTIDCRGYLNIKTNHKKMSIKLNKYDENTNKLQAVTSSILIGSSWHSPQTFDAIECYDNGETAELINNRQNVN